MCVCVCRLSPLMLVLHGIVLLATLAGCSACGYPGSPAHSTVTFSSDKIGVGTRATYTCDPGLQLLGPANKQCQENSTWLPEGIPFCVINVAKGKAPMQSSTAQTGIPQKAVDGTTSGFFSAATCTLTQPEAAPFWYVNLLEPFVVQLVRIDFGRSCCQSNVPVTVVVRVGNNRPDLGENPVCNRFVGFMEEGRPLFLPCSPPVPGAFVSVHLEGPPGQQLSICETFVYTDQAVPVEQCPYFADQPLDASVTYNGRCYTFYNQRPLSFVDAQDVCLERGGSLIDTSSPALQGFLSWELWRRHRSDPTGQYWMGAVRDPLSRASWRWIDGRDVDVSFWSPPAGDGNCARFDGSKDWLWSDTDCNLPLNFICQHEPLTCGRPEQPPNSSLLAASFSVGGRLEYRCEPGHVLSGPAHRVCLPTGFYSGFPPTCNSVECGLPAAIAHGSYRVSNGSREYGSLLKYSCDPGHVMVGRGQLVCDADRRWNGPPPTCQPLSCPEPAIVLNGGFRLLNGSRHVGTTVEYFCLDERFSLVGAERLLCLQSGSYDNVAPVCRENAASNDRTAAVNDSDVSVDYETPSLIFPSDEFPSTVDSGPDKRNNSDSIAPDSGDGSNSTMKASTEDVGETVVAETDTDSSQVNTRSAVRVGVPSQQSEDNTEFIEDDVTPQLVDSADEIESQSDESSFFLDDSLDLSEDDEFLRASPDSSKSFGIVYENGDFLGNQLVEVGTSSSSDILQNEGFEQNFTDLTYSDDFFDYESQGDVWIDSSNQQDFAFGGSDYDNVDNTVVSSTFVESESRDEDDFVPGFTDSLSSDDVQSFIQLPIDLDGNADDLSHIFQRSKPESSSWSDGQFSEEFSSNLDGFQSDDFSSSSDAANAKTFATDDNYQAYDTSSSFASEFQYSDDSGILQTGESEFVDNSGPITSDVNAVFIAPENSDREDSSENLSAASDILQSVIKTSSALIFNEVPIKENGKDSQSAQNYKKDTVNFITELPFGDTLGSGSSSVASSTVSSGEFQNSVRFPDNLFEPFSKSNPDQITVDANLSDGGSFPINNPRFTSSVTLPPQTVGRAGVRPIALAPAVTAAGDARGASDQPDQEGGPVVFGRAVENEIPDTVNIRQNRRPGVDEPTSLLDDSVVGAKLNLGGIIALGVFGGFVFLAAVVTTIVIIVRRGQRYERHQRSSRQLACSGSSDTDVSPQRALNRYYRKAWQSVRASRRRDSGAPLAVISGDAYRSGGGVGRREGGAAGAGGDDSEMTVTDAAPSRDEARARHHHHHHHHRRHHHPHRHHHSACDQPQSRHHARRQR